MNLIGQTINGLIIVGDPQRRGSNYRYPCECTLCGKRKEYTLQSIRNRKQFGCGCAVDGLITKNGVSFAQWCLDNDRLDLLKLWSYDLNQATPEQVSSQSQKERWFKCESGRHESFLFSIPNLTRHSTHKCFCVKCNSFAQHLIDLCGDDALEKYWDYDKNVLDPWNLPYGSSEVIYIKCQDKQYHGSYDTSANAFLSGGRCPYCRHLRVHPLDSFASYCNQKLGDGYIDQIWDYKNNSVSPWKVAPQSNIYVYLKCTKNIDHPSYKIFLPNVFKTKYRCAQCALEEQNSVLQSLVMEYIRDKYRYEIYHEYDCTIKCKNPKTNRWLRYDNEVIVCDNKRLIIEVHGMQHFVADCGYNRKRANKIGDSIEQVLQEQQYRDEYKKQYALSKGYHYLAIPYWTEHDGSYKTLIDQKIQEILSQNTTK